MAVVTVAVAIHRPLTIDQDLQLIMLLRFMMKCPILISRREFRQMINLKAKHLTFSRVNKMRLCRGLSELNT